MVNDVCNLYSYWAKPDIYLNVPNMFKGTQGLSIMLINVNLDDNSDLSITLYPTPTLWYIKRLFTVKPIIDVKYILLLSGSNGEKKNIISCR